jgi:dynein light chain roadblock-type
MAKPSRHDSLDDTLGRLSKKPGVKATIVIDRASGTIVKTSGNISALRNPKEQAAASFSANLSTAQEEESQGAEEVAAMVWNFVNASTALVQELDTEVGLGRKHGGPQYLRADVGRTS